MSEYQFKPYQKVLTRNNSGSSWEINLFGREFKSEGPYKYSCLSGFRCIYCIPYEGNEHLLGTNFEPEPRFEPKKGQLVAVSDDSDCGWEVYKYADYRGNSYWCVLPEGNVDNEDSYISWAYCEPLKKHFDIGE